jgi:hypothetical protein
MALVRRMRMTVMEIVAVALVIDGLVAAIVGVAMLMCLVLLVVCVHPGLLSHLHVGGLETRATRTTLAWSCSLLAHE